MASKDYYYILGVHPSSSNQDIKAAYRKLSKKFHPDLNEGDRYFESRFREVQEAYDVLSDPIRREEYDKSMLGNNQYTPTHNSVHQNETEARHQNKRRVKKGGLIVSCLLMLAVFTLIRQGIKKEVHDFSLKQGEEEYTKSVHQNTDTSSVFDKVEKLKAPVAQPAKETLTHKKEADNNYSNSSTNVDASFPGGSVGWQRYLIKTLRYPQQAQDREIQGTVVVKFIVNEDGSVSDPEAIDGPDELREEAVRVIQKSHRWLPAIEDGVPVLSTKMQPITFRLESF